MIARCIQKYQARSVTFLWWFKILFPNKKFASSLYKNLGNQHCDFLEKIDIKEKII